ncbi:lytic transglycosylase [Marivivens niveibacter]|uniref:Lytic transglycosylase n=1 Tax=Marivivens niveibacter TaxID=1930667 RepID=A0A251WZH8_9RHOB|nr:transglycosylase SLT domain-containing protein [Marivivens niveibacter]OUD09538.1 lytic transglycosylase [Marivivens niveibacter]
MSRFFLALGMVLVLGSCGEREGSAPRNLDNACAILTERSNYVGAFRAAERKWGVEPHVLMAMIYQESKFISNARTPHQYALGVIPIGRQSSAFGYSQALDGTWREYQRAEGGVGARRDDIRDAADFMGWYMTQTANEVGIPLNDVRNQYLAYHEGRTGFIRGTYRSKSWLVRIAGEITDRAVMYESQLRNCRAARRL